MARVYYLPGISDADEYADAASKTVFIIDNDGRFVATVKDTDTKKFTGRAEFWVEGTNPAPTNSGGETPMDVDTTDATVA